MLKQYTHINFYRSAPILFLRGKLTKITEINTTRLLSQFIYKNIYIININTFHIYAPALVGMIQGLLYINHIYGTYYKYTCELSY